VRLNVTKTFIHKKHKDLEYYYKRKLVEKRSIGLAVAGRKRGEEEIVISQASRVLNLPLVWFFLYAYKRF
jgi:hypothetical protein